MMNLNKTKVMATVKGEGKINIMTCSNKLKQETKIQYLGIIIEEKGNLKSKVNKRMGKSLRMY